MAATKPAMTLSKIESLWFADGTLVLQAENTIFRVYPGLLATASPVFKDMLAFPQPHDGPKYEGCPLVQLHDSASDVAHFLKAIIFYNYFEPWPADVTFFVMSAVLRLSSKYQVEPLRRRALVLFSKGFPITPQAFGEDKWELDPMVIAKLAREANADWILPIALSYCALAEPEQLLNSPLNPSDTLLCLRARDRIQNYWAARMLSFLWTPLHIPGCSTSRVCSIRRIEQRKNSEAARMNRVPILKLWGHRDWEKVEDVCGACMRFMMSSFRENRQAFWEDLPNMFGLPEWATLIETRAKAMAGTDDDDPDE
ncbi:BTB domain-containing protein [Favolaschia claudopus]|uniref:BTB domain-containing protein n=1 Tax=Favolaschia claudopus TaxID=2862362 RepID=A0AAW0DDU2_9AGAR